MKRGMVTTMPRSLSLLLALLLAVGPVALAPAEEYVIGSRDVLKVTVWGQDDLSKEYPVDPDGYAAIPLVGRVKAAGLTPTAFAAALRTALEKDYLVNPQVLVSVKEFQSQKVHVNGEAEKPGAYPLDKETNILEGITLAGGFTDKASPGRVRVIRSTAAGGQEVISVDMNDVIKRGQRDRAISLRENDVVVVPESFF